MTAETLALISSFFVCSQAADRQLLSQAEIAVCNATFEEVKMSFVDGVIPADFADMTPAQRLEANTTGYNGYLSWREDNAALVARMEDEARRVLIGDDGDLL